MAELEEKVKQFSAVLDIYPAAFSGNRLNLLFVEDIEPIFNGDLFLKQIDAPGLMDEGRRFLLEDSVTWPFPYYDFDREPDPWRLSLLLFDRFELANEILFSQHNIGKLLERQAVQKGPRVIVLVIVDGLSYYDLKEPELAKPCLVPGQTTTQFGYRAIIGNPSVSRRLFSLGYMNQHAFTYYPPARDKLSGDIHDTFSHSQVTRVKEFDEVLEHLAKANLRKSYVQVVLAGLDHLSHSHPDKPPRDLYCSQILTRFDKLFRTLEEKNQSVIACLTADHGILWRDLIEEQCRITDDLYSNDSYHPRYLNGAIPHKYGRTINSVGRKITAFKIPWMNRRFRNNEWGVHGGISAWESIVPLIIKSTI